MSKKYLFPVKLLTLMCKLGNKHIGCIPLGGYPNDGLYRLPLMCPEMHGAFDKGHVRFRLAYPAERNLVSVREIKLEIYNQNGHLMESHVVVDLEGEQSLALQAELMYIHIKSLGGYINPL